MSAQPAYSHLRAEAGGLAPVAVPTPKMSFYDLQNKFWELHDEATFSPAESHLYFYLLRLFNAARWPAKIYRKRNALAAEVNLDFKTLDKARARLESRGLLTYVAGNKVQSATWSLADCSQMEGKISPESENCSQMEGNNSAAFGSNKADCSQMEGKISPLYKEEEKIVGKEEEKTLPDAAARAAAPRVEKKIGLVSELPIAALPADPAAAAHTKGGAADVATSITKRRLLLRDSPLATLPAFLATWQAAAQANPATYAPYAGADLAHYHGALLGWSNAEGKTKYDWLATILGSMRRDAEQGRLRRPGAATPGAAASQVSQRQANSAALRARYQPQS